MFITCSIVHKICVVSKEFFHIFVCNRKPRQATGRNLMLGSAKFLEIEEVIVDYTYVM